MKIVFLYQGVEGCKESVGDVLLQSLSDNDFDQFKCLSAFASPKGVNGLKEAIIKSKEHIKRFSVIIGIDQNNTSKEALEALLDWNVGASIYYTSSPITFHPKVYLFEGKDKTQIIVGSSNLTKQGLFQNVEASLKVDFNKPDTDGDELVQQINSYLEPFFDGKIANLQKLTPELIQQLFESGIILSEAEKKKRTKQKRMSQKEKQDSGKTDALKALFPTVPIQTTPESFKGEKQKPIILVPAKKSPIVIVPTVSANIVPLDPWAIKGKLLWQKKLTPRDLQIVSERSAPTGVISLTRGLKVNGQYVHWLTYFRKEVFKNFNWIPDRQSSEAVTTKVKFRVKIVDKDLGEVELKLRHNPKWESDENNYTTGLSLGAITNEIKKPTLEGKIISLYAPTNGQKEPFYLEIEGETRPKVDMVKWFG